VIFSNITNGFKNPPLHSRQTDCRGRYGGPAKKGESQPKNVIAGRAAAKQSIRSVVLIQVKLHPLVSLLGSALMGSRTLAENKLIVFFINS